MVRVVRTTEEWDGLEEEWANLFERSPTASPPLRFEWLRGWWKTYGSVYGNGGRGLRILTVRRGLQIIGALPLYEHMNGVPVIRARSLRFLSTGEAEAEETCPCYLDLLHLPGEGPACVQAIGATLFRSADLVWDELTLEGLSASSPLLAWQEDPGAARERMCLTPQGACCIADLGQGMEAYVQRLSPKARHEARRLLRAVQEVGMRFEVAQGPEAVDSFFRDLVLVHQRRWNAEGKPGCFAAARFTEFHRSLIELLVPRGKALLARLSLGEKPIAVLYGHVAGSKFDLYVVGADPERVEAVRSPGTAAHLLLMEHLIGRGVTQFDYLRKSGPSYKERFATDERPLVQLRATKSNMRTALGALAGLARRAWHRGWRRLRRTDVVPPPASRTG